MVGWTCSNTKKSGDNEFMNKPSIMIGFRPYMSLMEPMYELVKKVNVFDIISSMATPF